MKNQEDRLRALSFSRRLAKRRQELGISQAELTRRIKPLMINGVKFDRASMSRYESGQNLPRGEVLQALAAVLEMPPEELLPPKAEPTEIGPNLMSQPDGMCRLTLDRILPYDVALQILQLVNMSKPVEKKD